MKEPVCSVIWQINDYGDEVNLQNDVFVDNSRTSDLWRGQHNNYTDENVIPNFCPNLTF